MNSPEVDQSSVLSRLLGAVVTPTRCTSLGRLEPISQLVEPAALADRAGECGLVLESQRTQSLESGKTFAVPYFRKAGA